jgi:tRNA pseudouridine38-40 synthase
MCECAYDGSTFNGWQKQPNGQAVQDKIEQTLKEIFRLPIRTIGAGRTDAGVHARGQVFHFDAPWRHSETEFLQALRVSLPNGISPRKVKAVSSNFHAHLSAKGKRYIYRINKGWAMPENAPFSYSLKDRSISLDAIKQACPLFLGTHDFSAFAASRGKADTEPTEKTVWRVDWMKKKDEYLVTVEGGGFLYKMVRSMVGALLDVGYGKLLPQDISVILASGKRTARVVSAPAHGLCLEKVFYRLPALAASEIEV